MRGLLILLAVLLILPASRAALIEGAVQVVSGFGEVTRDAIRGSVGFH